MCMALAGRRALWISISWMAICINSKEAAQGNDDINDHVRHLFIFHFYLQKYLNLKLLSCIFYAGFQHKYLFFFFKKLFKSNYFLLVAALEPKKWKLRAHSLENIARQEMAKGKLHLLKLMHSFQVKTLSKNNNNLICMNPSRCLKTFQLLKRDYATLRRKLEAYFQVGRISLLLSHFKLILIYILRYTNIYIYIYKPETVYWRCAFFR